MDTKILTVSSINDKGEGLAFTEGKEIFLDNALPGEKVNAVIGDPFAAGSKRCPGKVVSFLTQSEDRREPFCPYFKDCGGCQLQHWSLKAQHQYKKEQIKAALKSCKITLDPEAFADEDRPQICRYKTIRYFKNADGKIKAGFYKKRSHDLIEVDKCALEPEWFSAFLQDITALFNSFSLKAYDEITNNGLIRNVMLRDGKPQRLALICTTELLSEDLKKSLIKLAQKHQINSLNYLVNDAKGNRILGDKSIVLFGNEYMQAELCGHLFNVRPHAFLQVNPYATFELYKKAVAWCGENKSALALDLCCGVGTMSLLLASHFKKVIGVEIVEEAVAAAKENAQLNKYDNVSFIASDLKKVLSSLINENVKAVIADPARAGLGEANCRALNRLKGKVKLALIFCSLTALKRDLPILLKGGWKIHQIQGVDMFPHSTHVETLVLLAKK